MRGRQANRTYRRSSAAALTAYVQAGRALSEARESAKGRCNAVCFPARRVQFNRPGLPATNPPAASMLCYFGARVDRFRAAYSGRGLVLPGAWAWSEAA